MTTLCAHNLVLERAGRRLLDEVSLTLRCGELVALVGPNGAGKSTLLRCMAAELAATAGYCELDGQSLDQVSPGWLARRRAVLPQQVHAGFAMKVADVVALARIPWRRHASPAHNRRMLHEAMEAADISAFAERDFRALSGGEQQRVQLARVLAQVWDSTHDGRPRYLLLDEPTSSLDIGNQQRLLSLVRSVLPQGIGVLAVLHDLNLAAAFSERICLLHQGRVVTTGSPAEVLTRDTTRRVYAAPLEVRREAVSGRPQVFALPTEAHFEVTPGYASTAAPHSRTAAG